MNRYSNSTDRTLQNRTPGIGLAYTHCKPTSAEIESKKRQQRRIKAAAAKKPPAPATAEWPPGFVSSINVDRHGRMI